MENWLNITEGKETDKWGKEAKEQTLSSSTQ